jgi:MYXO-CTERM domain-containing protein
MTPVSRDGSDSHKDPTGPCGVARAVPPQPQATYAPGQTLHVEWTETVSHPGCFVVDFSAAGDTDFQVLGVKSHAGAAGATPRPWSLDVTLPGTPCDDCTLRVRQLMLGADLTDAQCPPATVGTGSTYYSCANVILTAGNGGGAGGDSGAGAGMGGSSAPSNASGCSYSAEGTGARGAIAAVTALAALTLTLGRRRRRRTSR